VAGALPPVAGVGGKAVGGMGEVIGGATMGDSGMGGGVGKSAWLMLSACVSSDNVVAAVRWRESWEGGPIKPCMAAMEEAWHRTGRCQQG